MRYLLFILIFAANLAHADGFSVSGGKLLKTQMAPVSTEFRIRGVNRAHYDSPGAASGIPLSGANAERITLYFSRTPESNWAIVQKIIDAGMVPIPGNWNATCKSDTDSLSAIVDTWVAQASTWTRLNTLGIVNIANEWGPNTVVWRDSYIAAIQRMRAAGYTGTLMIDSGSCGQSPGTLVKWGADVLNADPLHNLLFSIHIYGGFYYPATASWQIDYTTAMAQLKASGLPIVVGEFGPGRGIGPSPTMIPPETIIAMAESNGWGWLAWAWDDNDLAACQADDKWFSMTVNCGRYTGADATELTQFGRTVVPLLKKFNGAAP